MQNLFNSKFAVVAILILFALALASAGPLTPVAGAVMANARPDIGAAAKSGPWEPPDPWEPDGPPSVQSSGPWEPPDPWEPDGPPSVQSSGPWEPPDPWEPDGPPSVQISVPVGATVG